MDAREQGASMTTGSRVRRQRIGFKKAATNPGLYKGAPQESKPEAPGVAQMARNLLSAARAIGKDGVKPASKEERARRLEICRKCEHIDKPNTKLERCLKCGCVLAFKSALNALHCPLSKW